MATTGDHETGRGEGSDPETCRHTLWPALRSPLHVPLWILLGAVLPLHPWKPLHAVALRLAVMIGAMRGSARPPHHPRRTPQTLEWCRHITTAMMAAELGIRMQGGPLELCIQNR